MVHSVDYTYTSFCLRGSLFFFGKINCLTCPVYNTVVWTKSNEKFMQGYYSYMLQREPMLGIVREVIDISRSILSSVSEGWRVM